VSVSGLRYYSTGTGRWVSKDPIGGVGGVNAYVFSANGAENNYDLRGAFAVRIHRTMSIGLIEWGRTEAHSTIEMDAREDSTCPAAEGRYRLRVTSINIEFDLYVSIFRYESTLAHEMRHMDDYTDKLYSALKAEAHTDERCYCKLETANCIADAIVGKLHSHYRWSSQAYTAERVDIPDVLPFRRPWVRQQIAQYKLFAKWDREAFEQDIQSCNETQ
jgi:hypothetical protein